MSTEFERSTVTVHYAFSAADYLLLFFALWLGIVAVGAAAIEYGRDHEVADLSACRFARSSACQDVSPILASGATLSDAERARVYFWFSHYFPRAVAPAARSSDPLDADWGDLSEENAQLVLQILRDKNRGVGVYLAARRAPSPLPELPPRQETWGELLESPFGSALLKQAPQGEAPTQSELDLAAAYRAAISDHVARDLEQYDMIIGQAWAGVAVRRAGPLWTRYPFAFVAAGTNFGALLVMGLALWRRRDPIPVVASAHALCIGDRRILWEEIASISVEPRRIAWTTADGRQDAAEGLRISPQTASVLEELVALCMQPRDPLDTEALQQLTALRNHPTAPEVMAAPVESSGPNPSAEGSDPSDRRV